MTDHAEVLGHDERAQQIVLERLGRLELAVDQVLTSDASPESRRELQLLLESFELSELGLCTYCDGSGIDDDPGMTGFYAAKYAPGRGWTPPEVDPGASVEGREEAERRLSARRFLRVQEAAWDVVDADRFDENGRFYMQILEAVAGEALDLDGSSANVAVCVSCFGSGLANAESYGDPWLLRHGWTPPVAADTRA